MITKNMFEISMAGAKIAKKLSDKLEMLPKVDYSRVDPSLIAKDIRTEAQALLAVANALDAEIAAAAAMEAPPPPAQTQQNPDGSWVRSSAGDLHSSIADGLKKAHGIFGG